MASSSESRHPIRQAIPATCASQASNNSLPVRNRNRRRHRPTLEEGRLWSDSIAGMTRAIVPLPAKCSPPVCNAHRGRQHAQRFGAAKVWSALHRAECRADSHSQHRTLSEVRFPGGAQGALPPGPLPPSGGGHKWQITATTRDTATTPVNASIVIRSKRSMLWTVPSRGCMAPSVQPCCGRFRGGCWAQASVPAELDALRAAADFR
jgi:hypothetical protein